jgi:hypothetical protein
MRSTSHVIKMRLHVFAYAVHRGRKWSTYHPEAARDRLERPPGADAKRGFHTILLHPSRACTER